MRLEGISKRSILVILLVVMPFLFLLNIIVLLSYKLYFSPRIVIVPHQNAVNDIRLSLIDKAKKGNPFIESIVIIGPDHFSQNKKEISYTDRNWNLVNGVAMYDYSSALSREISKNYPNNEKLKYDHAIYNLLDPIQKSFPDSKILPILIGEKVDYSKLSSLLDILEANCGWQCLIVFSVDFSHYLPYPVADIHDMYSIKTLYEKKYEDAKKLEVDSPQSLYIAMQLAKRWKLNFKMESNTNSAKLVKNQVAESTSHVLGYYSHSIDRDKMESQTFIYSYKIGESLLKLGDRLFYGTENVTLNFDGPKTVNNVDIVPIDKGKLEMSCVSNRVRILFPENVLVTGYTSGEKTILVFSPDITPTLTNTSCIKYDATTHVFMLD